MEGMSYNIDIIKEWQRNQVLNGSAPKFSQQGCTHSVKVFTHGLLKLYIVTYFLLEEE
jgi:hypothetical protein